MLGLGPGGAFVSILALLADLLGLLVQAGLLALTAHLLLISYVESIVLGVGI
jgi:hypothetical protein